MKPSEANSRYRRCRPLIGTFFEVSLIRLPSQSEEDLQSLADSIFQEVERLDRIFSFHLTESELSSLNRLEVGQTQVLSDEMNEVLSFALELQHLSQGAFNVAIGNALVEWKFLPGESPSWNWLNPTSPAFLIHEKRFQKTLPSQIDLGGIAKGKIVDACVDLILRKIPGLSGSINAGGDIRVFGFTQEAWIRSGSQNDSHIRSVFLYNQAIATSTVNVLNGKSPYVDLIQRDSLQNLKTATVVAETCMIADALTKIVLLNSPNQQQIFSKYRTQAEVFA